MCPSSDRIAADVTAVPRIKRDEVFVDFLTESWVGAGIRLLENGYGADTSGHIAVQRVFLLQENLSSLKCCAWVRDRLVSFLPVFDDATRVARNIA